MKPYAELGLPKDLPHPSKIEHQDQLAYVAEVMRRMRAKTGDRTESNAAAAARWARDLYGLELSERVTHYVAQRSWLNIPEPWRLYLDEADLGEVEDEDVKNLGF